MKRERKSIGRRKTIIVKSRNNARVSFTLGQEDFAKEIAKREPSPRKPKEFSTGLSQFLTKVGAKVNKEPF